MFKDNKYLFIHINLKIIPFVNKLFDVFIIFGTTYA